MTKITKLMRVVCGHCNRVNEVLPPRGTALFRLPKRKGKK